MDTEDQEQAGSTARADAGWWAQVQVDLQRQEYQASAVDGLYQAPNRAHNLRTFFHPTGVEVVGRTGGDWSWTWSLAGLRRGGESWPAEPAEPVVDGATSGAVEYRRGLLVERYGNDERGLEQQFVLHERLPGSGALILEGQIGGSLAMRQEKGEVLFVDAAGNAVLEYGHLAVLDAEGRQVPARLAASGDRLRLWIWDGGYDYPLYVDPLLTSPSWTAESDQISAYFGASVGTAGDVNGDGYDDLIVGAPYYDVGRTNEGRIFVYYGSVSGPSTTAGWTVESNQSFAYLGISVSTAGDVNGDGYDDVIAGAHYYSNGQTKEGRAFVYHGSASGLSTTPNWFAEGNQALAYFGYAAGSAGDVNGDGYDDVIVGAYGYDNEQTDEGRVYVFYGSAGGLGSTSWTAESDQNNARLGISAGTAGDVNGDGYDDVIAGAYYYDNGQTDEGKVFAWYGGPGGLGANGTPANADWSAESDQASAYLGMSVSTAGDVNGDGYDDVIIGAYGYDNPETDEGKAFAWYGGSGGLGDSGIPANADWSAESNQAGAQLGRWVATAGDVDRDGYADVLVGAYAYDNGQTDEGKVFAWYGGSGGLGSSGTPANADWSAEGNQAGARFGLAAGTAGDVNHDQYDDVVIGADKYDNGQTDEGKAFAYLSTGAPPPTVRKFYYFNGQRIAMRLNGVLYYLVGDHLGTTSLVLNAQGNVVSEARHYPYGEERWHTSTLPTDYRFTGQAYEQSLGLYHMGARWYDGSLGRWLSADTIVPELEDPQSLNRLSYVCGNPLKYRDPSGHAESTGSDKEGSLHPEIHELYQTLGLEGVVDYVVFEAFILALTESNALPLPNQADLAENPWPVDAIGWRVEGSFMPLMFGGDMNLDLVYNLNSGETDVFLGLSVQAIGEGGSITTGPLAVFGLAENAGYEGAGAYLGGTVVTDFGAEGDLGVSFSEYRGERPVSVYLGGGGGAEASVYAGVGGTFRITDILVALFPAWASFFSGGSW